MRYQTHFGVFDGYGPTEYDPPEPTEIFRPLCGVRTNDEPEWGWCKKSVNCKRCLRIMATAKWEGNA